jgi:redox-sensing transcriptional repressor
MVNLLGMTLDIPEVVVERLPMYARALQDLLSQGREVVSSQELGDQLGVTPAQIRKDLSYFGRFGKQGRGYNIGRLVEELHQILGLERDWAVALVGVGHLGKAILHYGGFGPQGFHIVAAFDSDPETIGQEVAGLRVQDVGRLPEVLAGRDIQIGVVAVPAVAAQEIIDLLVGAGVQAILNYAPIAARVPPGVHVRHIDPVLALQSMTFYVKDAGTVSPPK